MIIKNNDIQSKKEEYTKRGRNLHIVVIRECKSRNKII